MTGVYKTLSSSFHPFWVNVIREAKTCSTYFRNINSIHLDNLMWD